MSGVVSKVKKIRTFRDDVMNARGNSSSTPVPVPEKPAGPRVVVIPKVPTIKSTPLPKPLPPKPIVTAPPSISKPVSPTVKATQNLAAPNQDLVTPQKSVVKPLLDSSRTVSVMETDDYVVTSGNIITDQKKDRFHLVPATWNALKSWVKTERQDWEKRIAEKEAAVPKVRAIETRKEVITKAAGQSALAPKDDHKQVVARRPEPTVVSKPAAVMEIKGKEAVPEASWSYFTDEPDKPPETKPQEPLVKAAPIPIAKPEWKPLPKPYAPEPKREEVKPVVPPVQPPMTEVAKVKTEPAAVKKPGTSFLWRHMIEETEAPVEVSPAPIATTPTPPKAEPKPIPLPEEKIPVPVTPPVKPIEEIKPTVVEPVIKPVPPPPEPEPEPVVEEVPVPVTPPVVETPLIEAEPEPEEEIEPEPTLEPTPVSLPRYEPEEEVETEATPSVDVQPATPPPRRFRPSESPGPRSLPVVRIVLIGTVAIVLGVSFTFWYFGSQNAVAPIENRPVTESLIKADEVVTAAATNPAELLPKITEASGSSGSSVILIDPRLGPNNDPIAATDMFNRLGWSVPDSFERAVEKINFGRYEDQPFIVIKVTSFDIGFSGLLSSEDYLSADLAWFFGAGDGAVTEFVDETVKNHDVRVLRDDGSRERIVYGFVNRNLIVITPDSEVFAGVASLIK